MPRENWQVQQAKVRARLQEHRHAYKERLRQKNQHLHENISLCKYGLQCSRDDCYFQHQLPPRCWHDKNQGCKYDNCIFTHERSNVPHIESNTVSSATSSTTIAYGVSVNADMQNPLTFTNSTDAHNTSCTTEVNITLSTPDVMSNEVSSNSSLDNVMNVYFVTPSPTDIENEDIASQADIVEDRTTLQSLCRHFARGPEGSRETLRGCTYSAYNNGCECKFRHYFLPNEKENMVVCNLRSATQMTIQMQQMTLQMQQMAASMQQMTMPMQQMTMPMHHMVMPMDHMVMPMHHMVMPMHHIW